MLRHIDVLWQAARPRNMGNVPLLTDGIKETLPLLGQGEIDGRMMAWVRWILPEGFWECYGIEFDGDDLLYALILDEDGVQFGYINLSRLARISGSAGLIVDRDRYFQPFPVSDLVEIYHEYYLESG